MAGIVIGVILLIIGVVFFVMRGSDQKKLEQLTGSGKQKLGELVPILKETKASLGDLGEDGAISENVTVMGTPKCDQPLKSPLGGQECIYYKYTVKNIWTERYTETNSEGRSVTRTRRHEDVMDSGESSVPFTIDDGTGTILVDPMDGTFEGLTKTVERSENNFANMSGPSIQIGGLSLNLNNLGANRSRPESIKYSEEIIGLNRRLTVVGNVCDKMGELCIQKNGKTKVIISTKSADEMVADSKKAVRNKGIGAMVCGGLGILAIIIGIISKIAS